MPTYASTIDIWIMKCDSDDPMTVTRIITNIHIAIKLRLISESHLDDFNHQTLKAAIIARGNEATPPPVGPVVLQKNV